MTPEQAAAILQPGVGPQLLYRHSDGTTFDSIDLYPIGYAGEDTDHIMREKRICRALLQHALDLLNGEDTFNA